MERVRMGGDGRIERTLKYQGIRISKKKMQMKAESKFSAKSLCNGNATCKREYVVVHQ